MKKSGQSLIELLVAIGLTAVFLPAFITGIITSREGRVQQNQRLYAATLIKESAEAIRNVRESGWNNFAVNGIFHTEISGNTWILVGGTETIGDFQRDITIGDVGRDSLGNIVETGGTVDVSTKKVTVRVTWSQPRTSSSTSSFYLTRYLDNLSFTQTSKADFDAGSLNGTATTNIYGGEVTLGSGGLANWCRPQDSIKNTVTLPKPGNSIVAKEGASYVGTGDGTNGVTFVNIAFTNPPQPTPPSASIVNTYTSNYKTNAVFSVGQYAYLATDNGSEQVIILDITQNPNVKIGSVTISGGNPANGVYVVGDILYVTSGYSLYTYDVTNKNGAHTTPLASRQMWAGIFSQPRARQVVVVNNMAYIGLGGSLLGMQVYRVSNGGRTISFIGAANLNWNQESQGLAVNSTGTRTYVAFNQGSGVFPKGFFIVDTSTTPPWWWPFFSNRGSYNTGEMDPRAMAIGTGNRAIIVGVNGAEQYQVIDISNESSPTHCGGLIITGGVFGVASVLETDGDAYSYIVTGEGHDQFKIIQGGNGSLYSTTGTFESSILDVNYATAFNRITALNFNKPASTDIRFQVAVANPAGSCAAASYYYVGPDGDPAGYFTETSAIPLGSYGSDYHNPGRCFRYKGFFTTTDTMTTPVFNDITINYSP